MEMVRPIKCILSSAYLSSRSTKPVRLRKPRCKLVLIHTTHLHAVLTFFIPRLYICFSRMGA